MDRTFETRLAWLAGIIDGEGWIGFRLQHLRTGHLVVKWQVGVGNTDIPMIKEVGAILATLGIKYQYYLRQARQGDPRILSKKAQGTIDCERRKDCLVLLTAIRPYLISKAERADIMISAINHRLQFGRYNDQGYIRAQDDQTFVAMMNRMTRLNGRKKETPSE